MHMIHDVRPARIVGRSYKRFPPVQKAPGSVFHIKLMVGPNSPLHATVWCKLKDSRLCSAQLDTYI